MLIFVKKGGETYSECEVIDRSEVIESQLTLSIKQEERWGASEVESAHRFRNRTSFAWHVDGDGKREALFMNERAQNFGLALGLMMLEYRMQADHHNVIA